MKTDILTKLESIKNRFNKAMCGPWRVEKIDGESYQARIVSNSGFRIFGYYSNKRDYSNLTHEGTTEFVANSISDVEYLVNTVENLSNSMQDMTDTIKLLAYDKNGHCKICEAAVNSKHLNNCMVGKSLNIRRMDSHE